MMLMPRMAHQACAGRAIVPQLSTRTQLLRYLSSTPSAGAAGATTGEAAKPVAKPAGTADAAPQHEPRDQPSTAPADAPDPRRHAHAGIESEAEIMARMREAMSSRYDGGGESAVEYEDGQPVAMKRSVKNNMFRYI